MLKPPVSQCHTATQNPCSVKAFYVESLGMKRSKAPARSLWPPFHGSMHHCKNWVALFFFSYISLLDHKRQPSRSILSDINGKSSAVGSQDSSPRLNSFHWQNR